jgi:hypothetical protein
MRRRRSGRTINPPLPPDVDVARKPSLSATMIQGAMAENPRKVPGGMMIVVVRTNPTSAAKRTRSKKEEALTKAAMATAKLFSFGISSLGERSLGVVAISMG